MIDNNLIVITGAPSSGKTTTLQLLGQQGYTVYFEIARIYIDEQLKKGKTLSIIRKDEVQFQKKVLSLKIQFEKTLNKEKLTFLERGIPDSIAYFNLCNVVELNEKKMKQVSEYKRIFLLDPLPFEQDYARTETPEHVKKLDGLLEQSYKNLGFSVTRVPPFSLTERVRFILEHL